MQELPGASFTDARIAAVSPTGEYIMMTTMVCCDIVRQDMVSQERTMVAKDQRKLIIAVERL